jgi:hypothetical protein
VAVLVVPQPLQAGDDIPIKKKDLPPAIDGATADAAITVWLDAAAGGRRRPAAKRLTQLHAEMAKRGYELVMMMPMNENNDTAGFWVTYRPAR